MTHISTSTLITIDQAIQLLSKHLNPGIVILLYGQLGAGKTYFTQQIGKFLNITDLITSPTYTLVNQYTTSKHFNILHSDLYRLNTITIDILHDIYNPNMLSIIEWPEKVEQYFTSSLSPSNIIKLKIHNTGTNILIEPNLKYL